MATMTDVLSQAGRGIDVLAGKLSESFGAAVVRKSVNRYVQQVDVARSNNILRALPGIGLTTGGGTRIHENTFFGR